MFITLTQRDCAAVRINPLHIVSITLSANDGTQQIQMLAGVVNVVETPEKIQELIDEMAITSARKVASMAAKLGPDILDAFED